MIHALPNDEDRNGQSSDQQRVFSEFAGNGNEIEIPVELIDYFKRNYSLFPSPTYCSNQRGLPINVYWPIIKKVQIEIIAG
ncbi:hypothetical protein UM91_16865 [Pseudomonas oryzihabitans]|nr:hypothetical protein UM91_16865 [Pseudomonas oryzihabitans]KTT53728.1 hypothetical protein NS337_12530 [Pseudomonas psychrotolerans]